MFTTKPVRDFFNEHLHASDLMGRSAKLASFSLIVANPAETGHKFGIKVYHLPDPGHLGRIDVTDNELFRSCSLHLSNILMWIMPQDFRLYRVVLIDGQEIAFTAASSNDVV